MADLEACSAAVMAALAAVPGSTAYDGYVPTSLPETNGYIDPYIVLWGGAGDGPPDLTADGKQSTDTLIWDFQTTAVGATPAVCRALDVAVQAALVNLRVGTGRIRFNAAGFNQQPPTMDNQTTPARFYLPRQWRLITN